jgi:hypothetical protein
MMAVLAMRLRDERGVATVEVQYHSATAVVQ